MMISISGIKPFKRFLIEIRMPLIPSFKSLKLLMVRLPIRRDVDAGNRCVWRNTVSVIKPQFHAVSRALAYTVVTRLHQHQHYLWMAPMVPLAWTIQRQFQSFQALVHLFHIYHLDQRAKTSWLEQQEILSYYGLSRQQAKHYSIQISKWMLSYWNYIVHKLKRH